MSVCLCIICVLWRCVVCYAASYIYICVYILSHGWQLQTASSAVENGVRSQDAHDLPWGVTVLVLQVFMEEIQVSWKRTERMTVRKCGISGTNCHSVHLSCTENVIFDASQYRSDKQQRRLRHPFQENRLQWILGSPYPWCLSLHHSCGWQMTQVLAKDTVLCRFKDF